MSKTDKKYIVINEEKMPEKEKINLSTSKILDCINSPEDIRKLPFSLLTRLAEEIRSFIITSVSETGGHLASNLGVVELTLALHRVFNTPQDKIIWDVGHQAYTHKLITGRKEQFHTLRQLGGISGYPDPKESIYDTFITGHSSTALSMALGLCCARDILEQKYNVIAVVGDGSMTAGMCFEALNNAGKDLVVILNDNEMSISPNVGAFSTYLNRIITGQIYNRAKEDIERVLDRIPNIGYRIKEFTWKLEESIKGIIVPGMLFEELGFRYFGPIDGHNLELLVDTLEKIKKLSGSILVHIITRKGKGYKPAEKNPESFHGTTPFVIETGVSQKKAMITYTDVFSETICSLAKKDKRIVAITAAMAEGTGLSTFASKFPKRFYDVGIAEQHAVAVAGSMAKGGLKPITCIYSTFLQRAYDQVIHDVCLQEAAIVLAVDRAGIVGADGATHQGVFDIAYLRSIPNLTLMAPAYKEEFKDMLAMAVDHNHSVAIRYPRDICLNFSSIGAEYEKLQWGKAEVICSGEKVAIWALGALFEAVWELKPELAELNINPTIVNPRFVVPLDIDLLISQVEAGMRIITLEDHILEGGFGSMVLETLEQKGLSTAKIFRLGLPKIFIPHGKRRQLLEKYALWGSGLKDKIVDIVKSI